MNMTEVYFLDASLARCCGPMEELRSLVWSERYDACGTFSMELPLTASAAAAEAVFAEVVGQKSLGRVEKLSCDEEKGTLTVGGRMAESLLGDRIILRGTRAQGTLAAALADVLGQNAVGEDAGERAIPHLTLGTFSGLEDGDGDPLTADLRCGGEALDEWLREVLADVGASYRICLNAAGDALVLEVYRGLDRTQAQEENSFAVFSTSFASLGNITYTADASEYKNFAFVAGEGEGEDRVEVTVDLRADPDEPLRELFVDARDLRSTGEDGETVMTAAAYRRLLEARGRERLAEHGQVRRVEGMTAVVPTGEGTGEAFGCMRAGVDFALGDLCDVVCERLGMVLSERVTELTTVIEGAGSVSYARFGSTYPDLRTRLMRAGR